MAELSHKGPTANSLTSTVSCNLNMQGVQGTLSQRTSGDGLAMRPRLCAVAQNKKDEKKDDDDLSALPPPDRRHSRGRPGCRAQKDSIWGTTGRDTGWGHQMRGSEDSG